MMLNRVGLRGDVLAGLTVAAYLIPQVMAYAGLAAALVAATAVTAVTLPLISATTRPDTVRFT